MQPRRGHAGRGGRRRRRIVAPRRSRRRRPRRRSAGPVAGHRVRGAPNRRVPPDELLDVLRYHLVAERHQVGDGPDLLVGRNAERGRGIGEEHVEIDQDASSITLGERGRKVRRDERPAGPASRRVDRQRLRPFAARLVRGRRVPRRARLLALGRPEVEAGRAPRMARRSAPPIGSYRRRAARCRSASRAGERARGGDRRRARAGERPPQLRASTAVPTTRARPVRSRKCMTSSATSGVSSASTIRATSSILAPRPGEAPTNE